MDNNDSILNEGRNMEEKLLKEEIDKHELAILELKKKLKELETSRQQPKPTPTCEDDDTQQLETSTEQLSSMCGQIPEVQDMSKVRFKKIPSRCDNKGGSYEVKMIALLFARALISNKDFHIASNVEAANPFDDIVLKLGDISVFLQLKHYRNANPIYDQEFVYISSKISLLQYCKLCLEMKRSWTQKKDLAHYDKFENVRFVFFTNSPLKKEQNPKKQGRNNSDCMSELENILKAGGYFFKISCKTHDIVYKVFENLNKYKQILSNEASSKDDILPVVCDLLNKDTKKLPPSKDIGKLLDQLEALGDLSEYENFLSELYFCVGQVSESGLDDFIKRELDILCVGSEMFTEFRDGVNTWWQNSNFYLTEKVQFWQNILQSCVAKLSFTPNLTLTFTETELHKVKTELSSDGQVWHVVSMCTSMSCLKIKQSLDLKFIVDVNTFQDQHHKVLKLWKWFNKLVVVESGSARKVNENVLSELTSFLINFPHKKLVIISGQQSGIITHLQNRKLDIKTYADNFILTQLDTESQDRVYKCDVTFQGYSVPLESLGTKAALHEAVTGDIVIELLSRKLVVGEELGEEDTCYVARTLMRKEHVRSDIFSAELSDQILAVSGMPEKKLKKLLSQEEDSLCRDPRCVLVNNAREFWTLSENYKDKNIHWLCKQGNSYVWKRSRGDVTQIVNYLANTQTSYDNYRKILDLPNKVALIVADPGMGKSTELTHLATKLKKLSPELWLIRIDLNDHTSFLAHEEPDAFELLLRAGKFNSKFQKSLFKHHVDSSGDVVVLMDGFDEISPEYSDKVLIMLKELSDTRISHICVTSRPVMRTVLEQELRTISFSFKPFTEEDQKEFLMKFWKIREESEFDLNNFIDELLKLTAKSLNDKMKKFTGIPLQTKMLAEIFQSAAEYYGATGKLTLPQKLDLLQLYHDFIDRKWAVFCVKNKEDMTKVGVSEIYKESKKNFYENHKICGLLALLERKDLENLPDSKNFLAKYQDFVHSFQEGRVKPGIIVDMVNHVPVFVHRTFAEFFVALWFSENFRLCGNYIEWNFLKRSNMVRKFFDRMLANEHKLHIAVLNQNREEVESELMDINEQDDGGRTALHLAVINHLEDFEDNPDSVQEITSLLLDRGADPNIRDQVLQWSPLHLAEKIGVWSVLEMILQKHDVTEKMVVIQQKIKRDDYLHSILREWAKQGYTRLIGYLLKCGIDICRLFPVSKSKSSAKVTMLHVAARHNQLNVVKFLVEHKADVNATDESWYKRTPLMIAAQEGNTEIVEYLLKQRVNVNAQDMRKRTALWYACSRGHTEVVLLLEDFGADVKVSERSTGNTLLHFAVKFGNLEMISQLKNISAIINRKNKQSLSPLLLAAKNGNWEAFVLLLECRADVKTCDKHENTALHYAVQHGDPAVIKLCIDSGLDIGSRNSKGQTPLLFAAAQNSSLEVMKTLCNLGADVTEYDNDGNIGLHYAAMYDDVKVMDWFVEKGADLNFFNDKGETPLWCAVQNGKDQAVDKLLELGADVNIANDDNQTPLYIATIKNHTSLKEKLACVGARPTGSNNDGMTVVYISSAVTNIRADFTFQRRSQKKRKRIAKFFLKKK